jgi:hypothetical protein
MGLFIRKPAAQAVRRVVDLRLSVECQRVDGNPSFDRRCALRNLTSLHHALVAESFDQVERALHGPHHGNRAGWPQNRARSARHSGAASPPSGYCEDIIPLANPRLALRTEARPKQTYLALQKQALQVDFRDGYAHVVVPIVAGRQMIVFEG